MSCNTQHKTAENIQLAINCLVTGSIIPASIFTGTKIWRGSRNKFALGLSMTVFLICFDIFAISFFYLVTQACTGFKNSFLPFQLQILVFGLQVWLITKKYVTGSYMFTQKITRSTESNISRGFYSLFGIGFTFWLIVTVLFTKQPSLYVYELGFGFSFIVILSVLMIVSLCRVRKNLQQLSEVQRIQKDDCRMSYLVLALTAYNVFAIFIMATTLIRLNKKDGKAIMSAFWTTFLNLVSLIALSLVQTLILSLCYSVRNIPKQILKKGLNSDGSTYVRIYPKNEPIREQTMKESLDDSFDNSVVLDEFERSFQSTDLHDIDEVIAQFIQKIDQADPQGFLSEDQTFNLDWIQDA